MFLRSTVVKKAGKTYRYWKLVETVRTATGPRQRVVAHLGDLAHFTAADWQTLAQRLGLGALLVARIDESRADVPWSTVAAVIAVNRLVAPMPEWRIVRWWRTTALPPLLGLPLTAVDDHRLYRCLHRVLPHKPAIEERIAGCGQTLFGQRYRFLLYDLTSTYFEGQVPHNPKAKRGHSRNRRSDCKQVCIGAVVDRGMVTAESLQVLRAARVAYILADRRAAAQAYATQVATGPWQPIRTDRPTGQVLVEVQEVGREDGDRLILVRSHGCSEKERGIHTRLLSRLTGALERLATTVRTGRLVDPAKIERRIGRILARHPGLARWVCARREAVAAGTGKRRSVIHWHVKEEAEALARQLEGVYLLRTNVEGDHPRPGLGGLRDPRPRGGGLPDPEA